MHTRMSHQQPHCIELSSVSSGHVYGKAARLQGSLGSLPLAQGRFHVNNIAVITGFYLISPQLPACITPADLLLIALPA